MGYVCVYYDGGQRILAEAYLHKGRIWRRVKRKQFNWCGNIGEGWMKQVNNDALRRALAEAVEQASDSLAKRKPPLHLEYDPHLIECLDIARLVTLPG